MCSTVLTEAGGLRGECVTRGTGTDCCVHHVHTTEMRAACSVLYALILTCTITHTHTHSAISIYSHRKLIHFEIIIIRLNYNYYNIRNYR